MVKRARPAFSQLKMLASAVGPHVTHQPVPSNDPYSQFEMLDAATRLTIMSLKPGSDVEVFIKHASCNRFWVARVMATEPYGFWFTFDDDKSDAEFMWFKDFLELWRFPYDYTNDHFTYENMDLMLRCQKRYKRRVA